MFRKGRREGRGTYAFANGAIYEGRFRDDHMDGMGTFNMPRPVFMAGGTDPVLPGSAAPLPPPPPSDTAPAQDSEKQAPADEKKKQPGDTWIVPIKLAQDIGTIHFLAGFDKEGM